MPHLSIKGNDDSNEMNDYIEECSKSGYPSVICKRYSKYADVDVRFDLRDSFSLAPYEDMSKDILKKVSQIVEKHTKIGSGVKISLFNIFVERREIPVAEALSAELHAYYVDLVNSVNNQFT
ncbi:hypothetical protein [Paracoccus sp. (in: a-proteobacteria)]|uniref:hypothetical protein n=1 Tax=Paracoccus sp. TaxID=267 RepID=UPI00289EDEE6|nr:hypothetical protein [Paracoccus sp. (in: a-proteobacteria)]